MKWQGDFGAGFVLVKRDGTTAATLWQQKGGGWAWRVDDERGGWSVSLEIAQRAAKRAARRAEKEKA